jgi:hypothetical protein
MPPVREGAEQMVFNNFEIGVIVENLLELWNINLRETNVKQIWCLRVSVDHKILLR